ncbi:uncharacterized protein MONOS_8597 [Monocercomonoides exilis]|uniref:uncharacterized protein n=1 Tax=Monocercomonoides exilis TaxID=2049356 RepID=UPI00355A1082|nr:hypothetical protein MONOS_8597 [Monocercomonoides exilis]|eukprot:MONOS_8597.1-p1 / transcript=MONOS_8597.1 / gene=MONOS_8597 / organism=Monocercomonoides_exilis_PA203 / gene_product=unspecified product / transcript_product=unspecified product / location=Mono_scaffold00328:8240-9781(-) / protein_length=378 / sequence_SO=supercontig / SO=protein_coding / is_pseudo=false
MSAASALAESSEEKDRIAMNPVDEGTKIPDGMINITLFAEMQLMERIFMCFLCIPANVSFSARRHRDHLGKHPPFHPTSALILCTPLVPHLLFLNKQLQICLATSSAALKRMTPPSSFTFPTSSAYVDISLSLTHSLSKAHSIINSNRISTDLAKQTQALFIQFVRLFVFEEPAVIPTQTALSAPKAVAMNVQCQPIASVLTSSRAEPIPFTQRITKELKTDAKTTTITFVVKAAHIPIRPLKMLLLNCFSSAPTIPFPPSLPHTFMNKLSIPQIQMTSHFQVCIQQLSHFDISLSLSSLSQIFDVPYRIVPLIFLAAVELRRADAILAGFAKGNPVQQSIPIQALSSSSIDPVVLAAQDPFNKMPLNSAFCAASRQ